MSSYRKNLPIALLAAACNLCENTDFIEGCTTRLMQRDHTAKIPQYHCHQNPLGSLRKLFGQFCRILAYGDVISSQTCQVEFQSYFPFFSLEYLLPQSLHWTFDLSNLVANCQQSCCLELVGRHKGATPKEMLQTWYQSLDSASRGCGKRSVKRFLKKCHRVSARLRLKELLAKPSIFFASPSLYRIDKSYLFSYFIFSAGFLNTFPRSKGAPGEHGLAIDAGLGYRYLTNPVSQLSVLFPFTEHFIDRLFSFIAAYYYNEGRPEVWNPEPKAFNGAQSSKEGLRPTCSMNNSFSEWLIYRKQIKLALLPCILWVMKKLWWKPRVEDSSCHPITDWPEMKQELRKMFLPCNVQWLVQNALRREKVNNLASAITVAESLMDFKGSSDGADKNKNSKGKKKFSGKNDHEASTSKTNVDNKGKGKALDPGEKLNALIAEEDEAPVEETTSRVNPLQLWNSIRQESLSDTRLMFVNVKVNGQVVREMVDTGATHNFLSDRIVARLGLRVDKGNSKMKAVNYEAKPIVRVAKIVPLQIDEWSGKFYLMLVSLDDFHFILGLELLWKTRVYVSPRRGGILKCDKSPCFIRGS
ncbi:hypothetical protein ES332_D04G100900v1 [Gossypium tomentosum]|uniref:Uncharacterized protein n=1 Tax=Gossypium tomentosum TaxID=34277 RepID=A0A5D2LBF4_GOSTO|nr:hypothetical protein ES332_D04G100900v1 [Gossypium tomentosum]